MAFLDPSASIGTNPLNHASEAIIEFHLKNPLEGYRQLISRWKSKPSRKGTGFEQPLQPHQHWHIDISYINLSGTFYYLCSILDGFSRFLVHWDA